MNIATAVETYQQLQRIDHLRINITSCWSMNLSPEKNNDKIIRSKAPSLMPHGFLKISVLTYFSSVIFRFIGFKIYTDF